MRSWGTAVIDEFIPGGTEAFSGPTQALQVHCDFVWASRSARLFTQSLNGCFFFLTYLYC